MHPRLLLAKVARVYDVKHSITSILLPLLVDAVLEEGLNEYIN